MSESQGDSDIDNFRFIFAWIPILWLGGAMIIIRYTSGEMRAILLYGLFGGFLFLQVGLFAQISLSALDRIDSLEEVGNNDG